MRAAGKSPIRADEVHTLAGLMLAGGVGRLISRAVNGRPHWFQYELAAVEFAFLQRLSVWPTLCRKPRWARQSATNRFCAGTPGGFRRARVLAAAWRRRPCD
jgi:hypothetical protein